LKEGIKKVKQRKKVKRIANEIHGISLKGKSFRILKQSLNKRKYRKNKQDKNKKLIHLCFSILKEYSTSKKLKRKCNEKIKLIREVYLLKSCFINWMPAIKRIRQHLQQLKLKSSFFTKWKINYYAAKVSSTSYEPNQ